MGICLHLRFILLIVTNQVRGHVTEHKTVFSSHCPWADLGKLRGQQPFLVVCTVDKPLVFDMK